MKIVHIITRLLNGGADENTVLSCNWAAAHGHEVVLVHGAESREEIRGKLHGDVAVVVVPTLVRRVSPAKDVRALLALARLLRTLAPDIVHTHTSKAGILGRLASRIVGARAVHGVHIAPFLNVGALETMVYLSAERAAERWTCAFVNVSGAMRHTYIEAGIGTPDKHHLIRSGMDLAAFREARRPGHWRALLGVPPDAPRPPVVLMLAAFERRKRHLAFLTALDRLFARHPEARILLAGDGRQRPAILEAIARCARPDNVRLLGFEPHPERLIALADVAVMCSKREGLPRAVVQYVAGGCPPVVTGLPGIEEVVVDGVNGRVLPRDDMAGLVDAIAELFDDRGRLDAMARACRAVDLSAWDVETMCRRQHALYCALLEEAGEARLLAAE